jgi:hypothetical protein
VWMAFFRSFRATILVECSVTALETAFLEAPPPLPPPPAPASIAAS